MTTEQAIRVFSEILENKGKISKITYIKPIYIELAIAALHAQQERENPKPLTLAIQSVQAERKRQDEKWGDQSGNHPFEWMSILGEEYGELCEAVNETFFKNGDKPERGGIDKMRKEAVQVAAVAVALIEALDKSDHGNIHDN